MQCMHGSHIHVHISNIYTTFLDTHTSQYKHIFEVYEDVLLFGGFWLFGGLWLPQEASGDFDAQKVVITSVLEVLDMY